MKSYFLLPRQKMDLGIYEHACKELKLKARRNPIKENELQIFGTCN